MNELGDTVRAIRELATSIHAADAELEDKISEITDALHEIANAFETLQDRFRELAR